VEAQGLRCRRCAELPLRRPATQLTAGG
jgi:hypothetical protein